MNEITAKEMEAKLENENLQIIDVREDDEVAAGMIPGAKHLPLGEIPSRVGELDQEQHYYIVCRSGGRSGRACEYLDDLGFKTTNVAGGMLAWEGEVIAGE